MKKKPVVWYLDDLPENLASFKAKHSGVFEIETFGKAAQVLERLAKAKPDALLCDIFLYDDVRTAKEIERQVQDKAAEIREFGQRIGANDVKNQAGVELIKKVSTLFSRQFPIYAYTSKGPYLLDQIGFESIGDTGAKWLFKGKYGASTEQFIIAQDVEEFHARNSFTIRVARYFWIALFGSGILGGLVVWLLTEQLPKLWR